MKQSVSVFHGEELYLDTMVLYALLRNIDPDTIKPLFNRIQTGEIRGYTSVLTFDELAYRLLLASIRDNFPGNPLIRLRENEAAMIASFYPPISLQIGRLQTFPHLTVLSITLADLTLMNQYILDYQLRPRDALHLAAMNQCSCDNLVSNDADFDRVSTIQRFTIS